MPREANADEDDTLDLTPDMEADDQANPDDEDQDGDDAGEGDDPDGEGEGEEETVVSFDGEALEESGDRSGDSTTIRELRKKLRDSQRRAAELERSTAKPKVERKPEPTLADCEFDEDKFKVEWKAWQAQEAEADAQEAQEAESARAANESWAAAKRRYDEQAVKHGFEDIADDEAIVDGALGHLSPVILKAAQDSAMVVRALGRSPEKLTELAKIKDPFELAAAVARMEGAIKVVKRRKGPAIDKPASGSGKLPQGGEKAKQLEKLEKDATRTGDRTELIKFKKANGL